MAFVETNFKEILVAIDGENWHHVLKLQKPKESHRKTTAITINVDVWSPKSNNPNALIFFFSLNRRHVIRDTEFK